MVFAGSIISHDVDKVQQRKCICRDAFTCCACRHHCNGQQTVRQCPAQLAHQRQEVLCRLPGVRVLPVDIRPVQSKLINECRQPADKYRPRFWAGCHGFELIIPAPASHRDQHPCAVLVSLGY